MIKCVSLGWGLSGIYFDLGLFVIWYTCMAVSWSLLHDIPVLYLCSLTGSRGVINYRPNAIWTLVCKLTSDAQCHKVIVITECRDLCYM